MSVTTTQTLLRCLNVVYQQPPEDNELRNQLSQALSLALVAVESPLDTVHRLSFAPLQLAMTKVAIDLNLFEVLVSQGRSMSVHELAQATGAHDVLLGRILRYLAAFSLVAETSRRPRSRRGSLFDVQLPAWAALPDFLRESEYQNPSDRQRTAFQRAHHTDNTVFTWFMTHPGFSVDFSAWMAAQRNGERTWLDVFPLDRLVMKTAPTSAPLFVDIGGGVGHQCVALLERLPQLVGRVVLEDLAPVVAHALPHPRVERLAHDFWTPQPVMGATFYYLRNVLHDYPDEQCVKLLQLQRAAMGPDSVLLVDELICPPAGAPRAFVDMDIAVMACLAAQERTQEQWEHLFQSAGLYLVEVLPYVAQLGHSVMVVKP
ncbi:S-adenosyl-L-methionine-dependent methyltransferase [Aspergillus affinis]|uniref:S-adenosyl-L-methionine-dependent methyltransferase n=1 Tax=Aspergillus affinis TaxID=1070780 RepID=UPI0022FE7FF0|nr:S-adenosyl-L-methionine-dependent methyltransferase [Aspergillus affinis]KAI9036881.1 S-adenosyl-L-methionine-dependent methyltransferase [Aspergillus affinis]